MNSKKKNIISDKLVMNKTGKSMEEWFKTFDKKGGKKLDHKEIFNLVRTTKGLESLGQWNHNLLATTYEWNRGLRERGQRDDGFERSAGKTISVSTDKIFNMWVNDKLRSKWLDEKDMVIRKSTPNKSMVISWPGGSSVRVELYKKNSDKTQVVIQHMKIPDSKLAEELKDFWNEKLDKVKDLLED